MRVASLADGRADLNETMADGKVSLSLNMRPGDDADTLLREVWDAGASDAFVLRGGRALSYPRAVCRSIYAGAAMPIYRRSDPPAGHPMNMSSRLLRSAVFRP